MDFKPFVVVVILASRAWALQEPPKVESPGPSPIPPLPSEWERPIDPGATIPSKVKRPLARAPSTVTVITADQIRRSGARFLTDVLRLVPGLEVQRLSSTESNVAARSYNDDSSSAQGILCLVDGRQVYNEFLGSVVWETLPVSLDDIERIEVIRGPGSFLYGPNAMHGVVNIVTRSAMKHRPKPGEDKAKGQPEADEGDEVSLSGAGGSYRSSLLRASVFRREKNAAFKAVVARDDIDEFEPGRANAKDKAFIDLRYERLLDGPDHRLEVAGGVAAQKFNVLIPQLSVVPTVLFSNEAREGFLRADYASGDFRGRASWTRFLGTSVPDGYYAPFDVVLDTADIDLQHSFELQGQTLTAGAGYRLAAFETEDEDVAEGRHKTGLAWAFLQDEVEAFPHFWLTGGVRLDVHSVTGSAVSPRLAALWEFEEGQSVRLSAGYGFRNPSLREIWFAMPVSVGAVVVGNEDLEPEQMRSLEAGYRGFLPGGVRVDAGVYFNLIDRLVEYRQVAPLALGPKNVNKEEAYGAEIEVDLALADEVSVFANFSWGIRQDRDTNDRIPYAPRAKANAGLRLTLPDIGLSSMLWATFFDEVEFFDPASGTSTGEADDYTLLSGRVQLDIPQWNVRLFAQAFNATDHDHYEHPQGRKYGFLGLAGIEVVW